MKLGIDKLLADETLQRSLAGKRVALLGHPASVTAGVVHSLDALCESGRLRMTAAFGPQHGMRGDKQDNMIESDDYVDPRWKIPVFSLYGAVRKPTPDMMASFDVLLIDLQDIGCRIYTYLTTLHYMLEACARDGKTVWVLDRPNPAGRPIEGTTLKPGWTSFVGSNPSVMRHGLTMGEAALWLKDEYKFDVDLKVVAMDGYDPTRGSGYGWPNYELAWVNPSPNIPTLSSTRCFAGTVMLEGTNLSEGRGTTRPLEQFGAPGVVPEKVVAEMERFESSWLRGCRVRPCYFEPTFHKFKGELVGGLHIHTDDTSYDHVGFRPYRFMLSFFKALTVTHPGVFAWRQPPYEYEHERLPIDLLTGSTLAREWVDDPKSTAADLERALTPEENAWRARRRPFLLYADG